MKTVTFLIVCFLCLGISAKAHPLHVSVTHVKFQEDTNCIAYSIKLFSDDFEHLINAKYNTLLSFKQRTRMTTKEQDAIVDYINGNFRITDSKGDLLTTEFQGWKIEDDAVWLFFCALNESISSTFTITNTLFLELFADQTNLVIAECHDKQSGYTLNRRDTQREIQFE
jgi:hypothetical protein